MITKFSIKAIMLLVSAVCGCNILFAQTLKEQAEAGDMNAQYKYALSLSSNDEATASNDFNESLAFSWFLRAAEQGHQEAQNNVGFRYYYGKGVKQSYADAFKWYQKSANNGDATAMYNSGICYEYGNGVTKSLSNAFICYKKSAEKDYEPAKLSLAKFFNNGYGTIRDYDKALDIYTELSENGNAKAQYELAMMYLQGRGVENDTITAAEWLLLSAGGGNLYVDNNFYVAKDMNKSARKKIIELTKTTSQYKYFLDAILGCLYEAEGNYSDAERCYKKTIEKGGRLGKIRLGLMYFYLIANSGDQPMDNEDYWDTALGLENYGFEESCKEKADVYMSTRQWDNNDCINLLHDAIKLGSGLFAFGIMRYNLYDHLLFCYYDGIGVKKDINKAIEIAFESLSEKNNTPESVSYYLSEAVLKASLENKEYSKLSFDKYNSLYDIVRNPKSIYSSELMRIASSGLGKAYYKGYGTTQNYSEAYKYLSIAADLDDSEAMRLLSACYRYGRGVQANSYKDKYWLDKAVKKRDDRALELTNRLLGKN